MAPLTRTRGRACEGKIRHGTQQAALAQRALLIRRGAWHGALVAYRCPAGCGGWHVGHREHRKRGRRG